MTLLPTGLFVQAQRVYSKAQQEIQQTVKNTFQALSDRDSVGLKKYCSADITLYEYGQVWNMDTLIRKAVIQNESADFKRTNAFEFINTELDKNTAWVTYRLHSTIFKDNHATNMEWLETIVLTKQNNQWKIRHMHSTLLKKT